MPLKTVLSTAFVVVMVIYGYLRKNKDLVFILAIFLYLFLWYYYGIIMVIIYI
jgi:hypothetical protein